MGGGGGGTAREAQSKAVQHARAPGKCCRRPTASGTRELWVTTRGGYYQRGLLPEGVTT